MTKPQLPTIETDPEASARYIRIQEAPAAQTVPLCSDELLINADLGEDRAVVGIEIIGTVAQHSP